MPGLMMINGEFHNLNMSAEEIYKAIPLNLKGGSLPSKGEKFESALKKAEKNAIQEFEKLLNTNSTDNWRFHSVQIIKFDWSGSEHEKPIALFEDRDYF